MADPISVIVTKRWDKAMKVLSAKDKELLKKCYHWNENYKLWRITGHIQGDTRKQIEQILNKINNAPDPKPGRKTLAQKIGDKPVPQLKKYKKGTVSARPEWWDESYKFWMAAQKRYRQLKGLSHKFINGFAAGLAEDRKINKQELPGWKAAMEKLDDKGLEYKGRKPTHIAKMPEYVGEDAIHRINERLKNEEKKKKKETAAPAPVQEAPKGKGKKNKDKTTPPAEAPKKTTKRKPPTPASAKYTDWKNLEIFKNRMGLACINMSYRKQMCQFIEEHGTDEHKKILKDTGINWKKWWKTPINKKTGEPYKQSNIPKNTNIEALKAEYREKHKK